MNKLLSLRRWKHLLMRVYKLLLMPQVKLGDKLLFIVPVVIYWILPDVLVPIPFMPLDDIAITLLIAGWFAGRTERKYGITSR
ncbi:conserved hypothetical protein [Paenibacillus curdlanolyticus YK9]|uniref:DUF1232 domain-containing protein n=1 Tax=Paenibacillus curdlanolyticus YK9 TaxID=717606 RepID=E0I4U7_9BACL|nr:conserved hypothetical protein [Paenibacillus curdlanolyticus YK9]